MYVGICVYYLCVCVYVCHLVHSTNNIQYSRAEWTLTHLCMHAVHQQCGNGFLADEHHLRMVCPHCGDKTCYGCKRQVGADPSYYACTAAVSGFGCFLDFF